ncbi:MAG TPA: outer membrane beta-barrel protein [Vicinamibacterales bacterium]|nr:outer membrane beta-barrel protein [Vicinamibacterales bacterium]
MRPTRLLPAALVGWLLVSVPRVASADIFVSPFLGLKFRGDSNELDLDRDDGARDAKMSVGISGVVIMDKGLGVELELAHQPRFFERTSDSLVTRSGVTTLGGNVLLAAPISFTRESLRPYLVGGLGWMHASANDKIGFGAISNDFLGLSLGVGAVGFIGDVTGLRFDLRYLKSISSSDVSDLSGDSARLSFWRATIGVVFR